MKIFFVSAHIDDVETGCGGTIAKFVKEGHDVYYAVFSIAAESVPKELPKDILLSEMKSATKVLGIKSENLFVHRYPVRKFPQFRQEILENLIKLKNKITPDLVFLPSIYDIHQDHFVIATEGFRAFKISTVLGYEIAPNNITFKATAFISLDKTFIEKKIEALSCYKSQKFRLKHIGEAMGNLEHEIALAKVRGHQIKTDYAEAFNVRRWIIKGIMRECL
jgi:LmbE family N-acetylglucosaminyl deacetylase